MRIITGYWRGQQKTGHFSKEKNSYEPELVKRK